MRLCFLVGFVENLFHLLTISYFFAGLLQSDDTGNLYPNWIWDGKLCFWSP